jgi:hypothetical protein
LLPGLGSLVRWRLVDALLAAWCVGTLLLVAAVELAVWNGGARGPTLDLAASFAQLHGWPRLVPAVPTTVLFALAVHLLSALGAARQPEPSAE